MSKAAILLFFKGIIFFILGLYLSSLGLPSDEADATIYGGNIIIDTLDHTANNPAVSQAASDTRQAFVILGIGSTLLGLLEIIISGILAFKSFK